MKKMTVGDLITEEHELRGLKIYDHLDSDGIKRLAEYMKKHKTISNSKVLDDQCALLLTLSRYLEDYEVKGNVYDFK